ncbi:nuclear transport factor 2 family protein [Fulvivirgaceae bacterium BMA10]|uniref:Nuclear transport factor 2 family protein n=1 Tax=Splendidivirga corallicola TaxID=3051826 RepID=A0ABT8KTM8_9BACT|nr:nuclear transport factor 2 family protein [Fulvivirgaceae bacterium BMA10]
MKKFNSLIVCLFCLISSVLKAQEINVQKEIDKQVWKPFIEAFAEFDAEKFNALHTDDVLRATPWKLRVGREYKNGNLEGFAKNRDKGTKRAIEFWFEHRVASTDVAYEVGYYKITVNREGEEERNYYARFHIVLKKIDSNWKIAQDWDTGKINGVAVTEQDYLKGKPLAFN